MPARACLNLLPIIDAITVDIGGGSTEFAFIRNKTIISSASLPLGTVRLKELYFDNILHGFEFSVKNMNTTIKKILNADTKTLKKLNIKPTRYDTIKPGALIILQLLHKMKNVDRFITSGVGVREGVYLSDLLRNQNYKFPSNYNPSVRFLLDNFLIERQFSNNLASLTSRIFDTIHEYYKIDTDYKHQQIILIATLVRFIKRKSPSKAHLQEYQDILPDESTVELLSFIITVSSALLTHRPKNT